jgi:hypothetical protein
VCTAAVRSRELSLFDELPHAGYAFEVSRGDLPSEGDDEPLQIVQERACRVEPTPEARLACSGGGPPPEPGSFDMYGWFHPPLYYAITGAVARAIVEVTPIDGFITAARLVGVAWLLAAMWLLYLCARHLGCDRRLATALSALLPVLPGVGHTTATVTNDAASFAAGAGLLLLALRWREGAVRGRWLVIAAVLVVLTKAVMGVAIVAALLAILPRGEAARRAWWRLGAQTGVAVSIASAGWLLLQSSRQVADRLDPSVGLVPDATGWLPLTSALRGLFLTIPPLEDYVPPRLDSALLQPWDAVSSNVLVAAALALVVAAVAGQRGRNIAIAAIAGSLSTTLAVISLTWAAFGVVQNVIPRFAYATLPVWVACLALVAMESSRVRTATCWLPVIGACVVIPSFAGWF